MPCFHPCSTVRFSLRSAEFEPAEPRVSSRTRRSIEREGHALRVGSEIARRPGGDRFTAAWGSLQTGQLLALAGLALAAFVVAFAVGAATRTHSAQERVAPLPPGSVSTSRLSLAAVTPVPAPPALKLAPKPKRPRARPAPSPVAPVATAPAPAAPTPVVTAPRPATRSVASTPPSRAKTTTGNGSGTVTGGG